MSGFVEIRPNVQEFTENSAIFDDNTEERIDVIIMCTGYDYKFKAVDESVLRVEQNEVELYKYVFPPRLQQPTLGIIGLVQAVGAVMPISEIQSRWFTRVIKGEYLIDELLYCVKLQVRRKITDVLYKEHMSK